MIKSPNHGQTCYVKTPAYAENLGHFEANLFDHAKIVMQANTRGCKNLEIKNYMYPTPPRLDFQPFCEPAFLAPHYPRQPCASSLITSRTFPILPTHFLLF